MFRYSCIICAIFGLVQSENAYFGRRVEGDSILEHKIVFVDAVEGREVSKDVELRLPVGAN